MQVDSIKTRVEAPMVSPLETRLWCAAFDCCFQFQVAPLHEGSCSSDVGNCVDGECVAGEWQFQFIVQGQGEYLVPHYTRGRVYISHGVQGESLVPPNTRGSVSLCILFDVCPPNVVNCRQQAQRRPLRRPGRRVQGTAEVQWRSVPASRWVPRQLFRVSVRVCPLTVHNVVDCRAGGQGEGLPLRRHSPRISPVQEAEGLRCRNLLGRLWWVPRLDAFALNSRCLFCVCEK